MAAYWAISIVIAAVAIIIAIASVSFKVSRWAAGVDIDRSIFRDLMEKVVEELKGIRDDIRGVRDDIRGVNDGIKRVDDGIKRVDDGIKGVRDDIRGVNDGIQEVLSRLPPPSEPMLKSSPLRLSEQGKEMSRRMGVREWAKATAADFAEGLRGKQPYEVHEFCFRYVKEEFRPEGDWDAKIGACAYESGMGRDKVLDVLAIELRDVLLDRLGGDAPSPGATAA